MWFTLLYIQNNYKKANSLKEMQISMFESDLVGELTSKMYFYIEGKDRNHNWPTAGREQKLLPKGPTGCLSITSVKVQIWSHQMKGLVHLRNVRENKITVHVIHKELRVKHAEDLCQVSLLDLLFFSEGRVIY